MKKSWKLMNKILSGQKRIESRWYKSKHAPWDRIKSGETIYFKDSGEPVTLKAAVDKVIQISELTPLKVKKILNKYGGNEGICAEDIPDSIKMLNDKKYCMLIFLKNPERVKPFNIDKTGFGLMSAWIVVNDINTIKR